MVKLQHTAMAERPSFNRQLEQTDGERQTLAYIGPWPVKDTPECPLHVPPGRRLGGTLNAFRICDLFV